MELVFCTNNSTRTPRTPPQDPPGHRLSGRGGQRGHVGAGCRHPARSGHGASSSVATGSMRSRRRTRVQVVRRLAGRRHGRRRTRPGSHVRTALDRRAGRGPRGEVRGQQPRPDLSDAGGTRPGAGAIVAAVQTPRGSSRSRGRQAARGDARTAGAKPKGRCGSSEIGTTRTWRWAGRRLEHRPVATGVASRPPSHPTVRSRPGGARRSPPASSADPGRGSGVGSRGHRGRRPRTLPRVPPRPPGRHPTRWRTARATTVRGRPRRGPGTGRRRTAG
jgi:hypothetical protein